MLFSMGRRTGWKEIPCSFSLGAVRFPAGSPGQKGFKPLGALDEQSLRSFLDPVPTYPQ